MCKGNNTTTTTQAPNPQAMATYQQIMQQAQGVAATPYQPYTQPLVAQLTPEQIAGMNTINTALPQYMTAADMATNAAQPISTADIQQYVSPWTNQVVGATEQQFANTLGQNLNAVRGNAISSGAYGGNREGVAEGITSGQVAAQEAPVIAGEEQQGYTQGVNTALAEQQAAAAGAYGLSSITGAQIAGGGAQLTAGAQQQATEQALLNAQYQQYLNAMGYPFQTTGWEAGVAGSMGSLMGGTSQTTAPPPSVLGQVAGAGTAGVGVLGASGAFGATGWLKHGGAVSAMARGGGVSADGVANRMPTIPEAPRTLHAQQRHMVAGHRRAMLFPHGTREIPVAPGMRRTEVNGEAYHYNPNMIDGASVHHLARGGREHELLGLGPFSKHEILHRINGGEVPAAVVERDREGTEVRATVGTHATAPHQWRHFHRTKAPGNTVHIENPEHTLAIRHHHHRADGGMVPGYDLGGGTPVGVAGGNSIAAPITFGGSPWSGAKLPVPQAQIPHGHLPAPPQPPQQQANPLTGQAKQLGELAGAIQKGLHAPTALPSASGVAASPVGTVLPMGVAPEITQVGDTSGSAGAVYRRGGRVPQYADGGGDDDGIYVPPDMPAASPIDYVSGSPAGMPLPDDGRNRFADAGLTPNGVVSDTAEPLDTVAARASVPPKESRARDVGPPLALVPPEGVAPAADLPPEITRGSSLKPADRDAAIRTIYGEAADQGPNGQAAVANVIRNRVLDGKYGQSATEVVHAPNQFEPWNTAAGRARMNNMTPEEYESIGNIVDNVWGGKIKDQTGGATHFYAPGAQAALGRNAPDWDDGSGLKIGDHLFFKPGGGAPGTTATAFRGADRGVGDTGAGMFRPTGHGGIAPPEGVAPTGIDWSEKGKLWPSLIMAGGNMMASRSPFPGVAIGEGVVAGAQTYEGLKQQEQAAAMNEKKIGLESKKLDEELNYHRSHLDIMTKEANTREAAEKSLTDWRARMNLKPNGRVTMDGHPVLTDMYGRGGTFDGQTMKPLDPDTPTRAARANWKASGLEVAEGPSAGHPILFDTTGDTPTARDGMTGAPIDTGAVKTRPAMRPAGNTEALANRLMDENQKQRQADPSIKEMTFQEALTLAHRAPNESQETIRRLNLAQSAWKSWHADPNNMRKRDAPEANIEYWEQRYSVSPTGAPTPAPAGTTPAPAGTGTPPTARPTPPPSAAPPPAGPRVEASGPNVGRQRQVSPSGKERWVDPKSPKGPFYDRDGRPHP